MGATSITEKDEKKEMIDDLNDVEMPKQEIDEDKLSALKAKMAAKNGDKMSAKIVAKKEHSLEFGAIGLGQAGSRLAAAWDEFGYNAVAINTAQQDLKHIALDDTNKLLLTSEHHSLGGAARELEMGAELAQEHAEEILELISDKLSSAQVLVICSSLSGGSGAGSLETVINLAATIGKPIIVLSVLPMNSEDVKLKSNALETLSKLAKFTENKVVNNLIVIDNARLEVLLSDVSQLTFFEEANKSIVSTLAKMNELSAMATASNLKGIDGAELTKLLLSNSLSTYGEFNCENFMEDTGLAESIINNFEGKLLASGFDISEASAVGFYVVANKATWQKINFNSLNYAKSMINDVAAAAEIYSGQYVVSDFKDDVVKIITFVTGLGLPKDRVFQLQQEVKELSAKAKLKDAARATSLKLDTGNETISQAEAIKKKIAGKSSAFGKLMGGNTDRRK